MNDTVSSLREAYLEIVKKSVIGLLVEDRPYVAMPGFRWWRARFWPKMDPEVRKKGEDFPTLAHSMIGLERMNNIQNCVESVLNDKIPGDLIETGVWRGGATIFMRAILKAYDCVDRTVWVADSFQGVPPPNPRKYKADRGLYFSMVSMLSVSADEVRANFERYGLLDEQVKFLEGWFRDTLPTAPIERLAVLRLDGDLFESTMDSLTHLYPKLSQGGYLIIDDYCLPSCRKAVMEYRERHGVTAEIVTIDNAGCYWRKEEIAEEG